MAARLVAEMVRDFEEKLSVLTIRPFDDGRFLIRVDGEILYDMDRTGRFPKYTDDIKPKLSAHS